MAPRDHRQRRPDHDTGPSGITVDELIDQIFPFLDDLLTRIEGEEFTTNDLIDLMLSLPDGVATYERALLSWGESDRHSKMVLHGQVIPGALRRSQHVEWTGYAHGENDEWGVPAWWRLVKSS